MANEKWISCTIGDIAAPVKNAPVGGPFGSNLVAKDYVPFGVPVIRGQNLGDNRWIGGEFAYVTPQKAKSLSPNLARPGDLIFTQRGTLGQISIVPDGSFSEYLVSQSQMKLTVDERKANPLFVYYWFKTREMQDYVLRNAIQTGVPHTNLGILRDTPITLPSLSEQSEISSILGSLDDKIELNCRMNQTLEALARTLFKSWFVDFDPVRAKAEGRDPGLPAEIAGLFPDSFEESSMGEIPSGWLTSKLGNVCEFAYGKALKEEIRHPGSVTVYGSNGQVGWHDLALVDGPGIVIGRKGNPGTINWVHSSFYPIDTTFYLIPNGNWTVALYYFYFIFIAVKFEFIRSRLCCSWFKSKYCLS